MIGSSPTYVNKVAVGIVSSVTKIDMARSFRVTETRSLLLIQILIGTQNTYLSPKNRTLSCPYSDFFPDHALFRLTIWNRAEIIQHAPGSKFLGTRQYNVLFSRRDPRRPVRSLQYEWYRPSGAGQAVNFGYGRQRDRLKFHLSLFGNSRTDTGLLCTTLNWIHRFIAELSVVKISNEDNKTRK